MKLLSYLVFVVIIPTPHSFSPVGRRASGFSPVMLVTDPSTTVKASIAPPESTLEEDILMNNDRGAVFLTKDQVNPLIRMGQGDKERVVNAFGLWCVLVSLFTGPVWAAAMLVVSTVSNFFKEWDPQHAIFDTTGKIWSKAWLTMTNCYPEITGEPLSDDGPCLYVSNHASWLDIPVLCTVLEPVFKFVAKAELQRIPCIGQQLRGVSTVNV